jgi:hypothetical protein
MPDLIRHPINTLILQIPDRRFALSGMTFSKTVILTKSSKGFYGRICQILTAGAGLQTCSRIDDKKGLNLGRINEHGPF